MALYFYYIGYFWKKYRFNDMGDLQALPFEEFGIMFEISKISGFVSLFGKDTAVEGNKRQPEIKNSSISLDIKIIVK